MKNLGFTLVETIITLMIMAVLTLMSARTIQQAFKSKAKIQDQLDQVGQVKDTLRLFERDINLAYHYRDLQKDLAEALQKEQKKTKVQPKPGETQTPQPKAEEQNPGASGNPFFKTENRVNPTTQFVAKESEIHFVSMNSTRLIKDSPQADFGEVSYFVDSCKYRPDKQFESGNCLFRRFSPIIDKDVTKGGSVTQLIADVSEFKLKFYSKLQKDWRKDWSSKDDSGEANTKGRYPEAVEVNLTVEPPVKSAAKVKKKKKISIQMIVPIHFPNNEEADEKAIPSPNPLSQ
jgi:prepilin-type N-terminal cleavage/methylation domain-containing protein